MGMALNQHLVEVHESFYLCRRSNMFMGFYNFCLVVYTL
jgi:hypothetical protein